MFELISLYFETAFLSLAAENLSLTLSCSWFVAFFFFFLHQLHVWIMNECKAVWCVLYVEMSILVSATETKNQKKKTWWLADFKLNAIIFCILVHISQTEF